MRVSRRNKKTLIEIANRKLLGELVTERLFFVENPQTTEFKQLWENCFNSKEDLDFIKSAVSPDQSPPQEESDLASL